MNRFSIITITYNSEKYLEETLSSVAAQTFKDFEHILWDGGSCDRTLVIAKKFPHLKIFSGSDDGISDAMNKGALHATGEFLLHLHSDDLLAHPDALLWVDTCLRLHPQIEWLYGMCQKIDENGEKIATMPFKIYEKRTLNRYNTFSHPSTYISRAIFEKLGGFDTSLKYCMDYDLWLRAARETDPFPLPRVLSSFRTHHSSLSTSEPLAVADEAYQVRNKYISSLWTRMISYRTWKKRRRSCL